MSSEEGALLAQYAAERDAEAFRSLVERHQRMVYGACLRVLGNAADAEDAAQDVFLQLARHAGRLRAPIAAWLHKVAVRAALETARKERRHREKVGSAMARTAAKNDATWDDVKGYVDEAIAALPENLRQTIVLYFLEGRKQEETARELGLTQGAVSKRIQAAVTALRAHLLRKGVTMSVAALAGLLVANAADAAVPATLTAALGKMALAGPTTLKGAATSATATTAAAGGTATAGGIGVMKITAIAVAAATAIAVGGIGLHKAHSDERTLPSAQPQAAQAQIQDETASPVPEDALTSVFARVEGIVVDEAGEPVSGVLVNALGRSRPSEDERTDEAGRYVLILPSATLGYCVIHAATADGTRQGIHKFENSRESITAEPLRIVLKPAREITVTVHDTEGRRVEGAGVEAYHDYSPFPSIRTDADGVATLKIPADAKLRWIIALKSGVGFDYFENYSTPQYLDPPPLPDQISLVLGLPRTVRVHAVDSDNRAVPGMYFEPWTLQRPGKIAYANLSGSNIAKVTTDDKGIAVFDWLPADMTKGTSFLGGGDYYHLPESPRLDPADGRTDLTGILYRNVRISGTVRLPGGQPATGVLIQAEGRGATTRYCRRYARTNDEGRYWTHVAPNQQYIVAVVDDDWAADSYKAVIIREDTPRSNLDFALDEGTLIHGRVLIRKNNEALADTSMTLQENGPDLPEEFKDHPGVGPGSLVRWTRTAPDGTYAFRVGTGEYRLLPAYTYDQQHPVTVTDQNEITADFVFEHPPYIEIQFHVQHEGNAVPNAFITAVGPGTHCESRADAKGDCTVRTRYDTMHVYAASVSGNLAGVARIEEGVTDLDIELAPAGGIEGRVLDQSGKPAGGIRVSCRISTPLAKPRNQDPMRAYSLPRVESYTDKDGRFALTGLPVGSDCQLDLSAPSGKTLEFGDNPSIPIREAATVRLTTNVVIKDSLGTEP